MQIVSLMCQILNEIKQFKTDLSRQCSEDNSSRVKILAPLENVKGNNGYVISYDYRKLEQYISGF